MRVKELKAALRALGPGYDEMDIEVWLPGSTIRLGYDPNGKGATTFLRRDGKLMIEGNVTPGSALDVDCVAPDERADWLTQRVATRGS